MKNKDSYNIFKEFDIRGIYPENLDEDTFFDLGRSFALHLKPRVGKSKGYCRKGLSSLLVETRAFNHQRINLSRR